jgi:monomeric sarcosine oxidase
MAELRVVVIGGGVMGLATGCALASRGAQVVVLERYTVAHERGSSHGLSRAIRHEYGPLAVYTDMVARSLVMWEDLQRTTEGTLYTETGILTLGHEHDGHTLPGYEVIRERGLPVELLSPDACRRRFPQFSPDAYTVATYNSRGGMLHASACLHALADRLRATGGQLRESATVERIEPAAGGVRVTLAGGETLSADRVVVTVGPWIQDILPELRLPIRATHQQVLYLGGLPPERFGVGAFPTFLASMEYYGFPLQGPGWLKVASHVFGPTQDPNEPQKVDPEETQRVRDWVRHTIPEAGDAPLVATDLCMYDLVADEDFILDRHPADPRIVIGSGFSGHGFKFGPLIGELLAALVCDEEPAFPLTQFQMSRVL